VDPLKALDLIPTFSGADDESFEVWYSDVCNIFSVIDHKKISSELFDIAVFDKLRGEAADIGRRIRSSVHPSIKHVLVPSDVDSGKISKGSKSIEKEPEDTTVLQSIFLNEFKKTYHSPAQAVRWFSKLDNLKQNGTDVIKYVNIVTNFARRANPKTSDPEIIVRIIKGLDDHYRLRICSSSFHSLDGIITALVNIQSVDPPKPSPDDSLSVHLSPGPSCVGNRHPNFGRSYRFRGNRLNNRGHRPIICYRCGIKGHIAPNCPDKHHYVNVNQAEVDFDSYDPNGCVVRFLFDKGNSCKRLTIPLSINGLHSQGLIDTGATITLVQPIYINATKSDTISDTAVLIST